VTFSVILFFLSGRFRILPYGRIVSFSFPCTLEAVRSAALLLTWKLLSPRKEGPKHASGLSHSSSILSLPALPLVFLLSAFGDLERVARERVHKSLDSCSRPHISGF
jgi:hypothetical protein